MVKFNAILSVNDVTAASDVANEPITVQEAKDYMRLEGFVDTNESTSDSLSDFDLDDDLITDLIVTAREWIESTARVHIVPKTLEVVFTNLRGMQELPGPVGAVTSLLDSSGTEITASNYTLIGNKWKYLQSPMYENMTITYEAGYGGDYPLPKAVKTDLLRLVLWLYENRGDDPKAFVSQLVKSYSRRTWLA